MDQAPLAYCRRCGRESRSWPIRRPDVCSPPHWQVCIRVSSQEPHKPDIADEFLLIQPMLWSKGFLSSN